MEQPEGDQHYNHEDQYGNTDSNPGWHRYLFEGIRWDATVANAASAVIKARVAETLPILCALLSIR